MGVDSQQHRIRTGQFNNVQIRSCVGKNVVCIKSVLSQLLSPRCTFFCVIISYLYIISYTLFMVVDMDTNSECDFRKWNTHTINKQTESAHNATLFFF